jgi:hypothetical protein
MRSAILVILSMFFSIACEPDCGPEDNFLVDAILGGSVVDIDSTGVAIDGEVNGIYASPFWNVGEHKLAVIACDFFGYPEICYMNGTKGRALGKTPSGTPTDEDITIYREAGSESDPGDLSGSTWYSNVHYPFDADTNVNYLALRGGVAAWGAGWNNANVDFCDIGNPNGTHIHCVQE